MMTLSTHVLDLANGQPAVGIQVTLFVNGLAQASVFTDDDGRCRDLLGKEALSVGAYRLVFAAGDYLKQVHGGAELPFYDEISVDFVVSDPNRHYHVPLLLSPFGYSTYRGS